MQKILGALNARLFAAVMLVVAACFIHINLDALTNTNDAKLAALIVWALVFVVAWVSVTLEAHAALLKTTKADHECPSHPAR